MLARAYDDDHLEVAIARTSLAAVLHQRGHMTEAEREYRAGLATRQRHSGPNHPELAVTLINLATILHQRGAANEAERLCHRALHNLQGSVRDEHPSRRACEHLLTGLSAA